MIDVATQLGKPFNDVRRARIEEDVRRAADRIIAGKGATWFASGPVCRASCRRSAGTKRAAFGVGPRREIEGVVNVTLSLPHIVGAGGIHGTLLPHSTRPNAPRCGQRPLLKEAAENVKL